MKTAIVTSDTSENHLTGDGHPEQPKRVRSIINVLKKKKDLIWEKPSIVPDKILDNRINILKQIRLYISLILDRTFKSHFGRTKK